MTSYSQYIISTSSFLVITDLRANIKLQTLIGSSLSYRIELIVKQLSVINIHSEHFNILLEITIL